MGEYVCELFHQLRCQEKTVYHILQSIGVSPRMPPKPIPTRWTSLFKAVEYQKEFLPYEKSF